MLESPRGVPILVARAAYSDALLRRVSGGTDLWFQVVAAPSTQSPYPEPLPSPQPEP